jgi:LysR family transcriptional regulator, regulator for metE and metH
MKLKLDLRHLQMLEAISQSRSLTDAAHHLSISPSALTHRIREAERRVAMPLLVRGRRQPVFTDAGIRMLGVASRCLRDLEHAERELANSSQPAAQVVRLGASTLSGYEWLPDLLRRLNSSHPSLDVEVVLDVSLNPVGALREGLIDIAIMPARIRLASVRSRELFRDEMVAVLPVSHPMSRRKHLDAGDLIDEPYITDGTTPETGREFERFFQPSGVRPIRVRRAGHTEAVIALVRASFGITILTRRTIAPYLAAGDLSVVRLTRSGVYVTWYAVLRTGNAKASAARTVADVLCSS